MTLFTKRQPVAQSYTLRATGTTPREGRFGVYTEREDKTIRWSNEYSTFAEAEEVGVQLCVTPAFDSFTITASYG